MNTPTEKQIKFISSLANERRAILTETRPAWLVAPTTSKQASDIIGLLKALPRDPVATDPDLAREITELRTLLPSLTTRDAGFAHSLIKQFDDRGSLSERQRPFVLSLISKAKNPATEVGPGLYLKDRAIYKVYVTQSKRLGTKRLVDQGNGKGAFVYERGALSSLADEHRLTEEQAREFGKQFGFCVACARTLDDDRSLAVGYGPVCADNHGWFYPTAEQASNILNRPTNICDTVSH